MQVAPTEVASLAQCVGLPRARYADAIVRQIEASPGLTKTAASMYFKYLAQDLEDAGDAALEAKAPVVAAALAARP